MHQLSMLIQSPSSQFNSINSNQQPSNVASAANTSSTNSQLLSLAQRLQNVKVEIKEQVVQLQDKFYGIPLNIPNTLLGEDISDIINPLRLLYYIELTPVRLKYNPEGNILNAWSIDCKTGIETYKKIIAVIQKILQSKLKKKVDLVFPKVDCNHGIKFVYNNPKLNYSLSNTYGPSMFEKMLDMTTGMLGQLAFMSGGNTIDLIKAQASFVGNMLKDLANAVLPGAGTAAQYLLGGAASMLNMATAPIRMLGEHMMQNVQQSQTAGQAYQMVQQFLKGNKVDLPDVWQNSTSNFSISLTLPLINPFLTLEGLVNNIVVPYAILNALATPIAEKSYFYHWPLQVSVKFKQGFSIPIGAITNLQVDINKTLVTSRRIDVSLTIQPLYHIIFTSIDETNPPPETMLTFNSIVENLVEGINSFLEYF